MSDDAPARYRRIAQLRTADEFRAHLAALGVDLPFDDVMEVGENAPLASSIGLGDATADNASIGGRAIGNRFSILPMEGWDGTLDGTPTDLTRRRWARFGESGGKLIWGGEAVAVRHDGRANPHQLLLNEATAGVIGDLRRGLVAAHVARYGRPDDLIVGLQLTHSGRYARPNDKKRLEPRIAYRHPILDRRAGVQDDSAVVDDATIETWIADFARAARLAQHEGFDFVDLKHCHGYFGHELLSAVDRRGRYGGSFENRTRFLVELVRAVRDAAPGLAIGVRLSAFDWLPFKPGADRVGEPEYVESNPNRNTESSTDIQVPFAFGGDGSGTGIDLAEPSRFLELLQTLDIRLVCLTAGSPYYNPHLQRPALFPPSDGYLPPEDPLIGVARQIRVAAALKQSCPGLIIVGSGYSYLQEWLPNVAQAVIRTGGADSIGLGRMVLSYPDLPAAVLGGAPLQRKAICRTFSDCTTAPRNGLISGCYPLDPFYRQRPEYEILADRKRERVL